MILNDFAKELIVHAEKIKSTKTWKPEGENEYPLMIYIVNGIIYSEEIQFTYLGKVYLYLKERKEFFNDYGIDVLASIWNMDERIYLNNPNKGE